MNKNIKLLLVTSNKLFEDNICCYINNSNKYELVSVINNGYLAYEYLLHNYYDIDFIIVDSTLPVLDGFSLISKLRDVYIDIKTIIICDYYSNRVIQKCNELGVDGYLVRDCDINAIFYKIDNIYTNSLFENKILDEEITNVLHLLGIPSHIKGFDYITMCIKLYCNTFGNLKITKEAYPLIAEKYYTSSSCVERAIRHAIEVSSQRCNQSVYESIFGYSINANYNKPTNSEFCITIAKKLLNQSCIC